MERMMFFMTIDEFSRYGRRYNNTRRHLTRLPPVKEAGGSRGRKYPCLKLLPGRRASKYPLVYPPRRGGGCIPVVKRAAGVQLGKISFAGNDSRG